MRYGKQSFDGDAGVVGRTVNLDGDYIVIGVMPAGLSFPGDKAEPSLYSDARQVIIRWTMAHALAHDHWPAQAGCFSSTRSS